MSVWQVIQDPADIFPGRVWSTPTRTALLLDAFRLLLVRSKYVNYLGAQSAAASKALFKASSSFKVEAILSAGFEAHEAEDGNNNVAGPAATGGQTLGGGQKAGYKVGQNEPTVSSSFTVNGASSGGDKDDIILRELQKEHRQWSATVTLRSRSGRGKIAAAATILPN
jgi:hypothetical protein